MKLGALASTVHVYAAAGVVTPSPSIASTWKVCGPLPSGPSGSELEQGVGTEPSTLQSKLPYDPCEKPNDGAVFALGSDGMLPSVGGLVSTVHVWAATWVATPFASTASTRKVCGPSPRPLGASGLVHVVKLAAPSSRHLKCEYVRPRREGRRPVRAGLCGALSIAGALVSTVTAILELSGPVQLSKVALTPYVYVPSGTAASVQCVAVTEPQTGVGVEPT